MCLFVFRSKNHYLSSSSRVVFVIEKGCVFCEVDNEFLCTAKMDGSLSSGRPGFQPKSDNARFLVDKVALERVSLPVFQFSPVNIIPPMLNTHSFTYHPRYIMFLSQYFRFPLSVPFYQRSIPIHSPTTHTI